MCMAFVRRSGGSNEMLAVGFADGSIRIYSLGGSQLVMTLGADVPGPVLFLEPHPRLSIALSASLTGAILWDTSDKGAWRMKLGLGDGRLGVRQARFAGANSHGRDGVIALCFPKSIVGFDAGTLQHVWELHYEVSSQAASESLRSFACSSSGALICAGGDLNGRLVLWRVPACSRLPDVSLFSCDAVCLQLEFVADSTIVAALSDSGCISFVDVVSRKHVMTIPNGKPLGSGFVSFSLGESGSTLLGARADGTAVLHDLAKAFASQTDVPRWREKQAGRAQWASARAPSLSSGCCNGRNEARWARDSMQTWRDRPPSPPASPPRNHFQDNRNQGLHQRRVHSRKQRERDADMGFDDFPEYAFIPSVRKRRNTPPVTSSLRTGQRQQQQRPEQPGCDCEMKAGWPPQVHERDNRDARQQPTAVAAAQAAALAAQAAADAAIRAVSVTEWPCRCLNGDAGVQSRGLFDDELPASERHGHETQNRDQRSPGAFCTPDDKILEERRRIVQRLRRANADLRERQRLWEEERSYARAEEQRQRDRRQRERDFMTLEMQRLEEEEIAAREDRILLLKQASISFLDGAEAEAHAAALDAHISRHKGGAVQSKQFSGSASSLQLRRKPDEPNSAATMSARGPTPHVKLPQKAPPTPEVVLHGDSDAGFGPTSSRHEDSGEHETPQEQSRDQHQQRRQGVDAAKKTAVHKRREHRPNQELLQLDRWLSSHRSQTSSPQSRSRTAIDHETEIAQLKMRHLDDLASMVVQREQHLRSLQDKQGQVRDEVDGLRRSHQDQQQRLALFRQEQDELRRSLLSDRLDASSVASRSSSGHSAERYWFERRGDELPAVVGSPSVVNHDGGGAAELRRSGTRTPQPLQTSAHDVSSAAGDAGPVQLEDIQAVSQRRQLCGHFYDGTSAAAPDVEIASMEGSLPQSARSDKQGASYARESPSASLRTSVATGETTSRSMHLEFEVGAEMTRDPTGSNHTIHSTRSTSTRSARSTRSTRSTRSIRSTRSTHSTHSTHSSQHSSRGAFQQSLLDDSPRGSNGRSNSGQHCSTPGKSERSYSDRSQRSYNSFASSEVGRSLDSGLGPRTYPRPDSHESRSGHASESFEQRSFASHDKSYGSERFGSSLSHGESAAHSERSHHSDCSECRRARDAESGIQLPEETKLSLSGSEMSINVDSGPLYPEGHDSHNRDGAMLLGVTPLTTPHALSPLNERSEGEND